jgi:hypothetical protein
MWRRKILCLNVRFQSQYLVLTRWKLLGDQNLSWILFWQKPDCISWKSSWDHWECCGQDASNKYKQEVEARHLPLGHAFCMVLFRLLGGICWAHFLFMCFFFWISVMQRQDEATTFAYLYKCHISFIYIYISYLIYNNQICVIKDLHLNYIIHTVYIYTVINTHVCVWIERSLLDHAAWTHRQGIASLENEANLLTGKAAPDHVGMTWVSPNHPC